MIKLAQTTAISVLACVLFSQKIDFVTADSLIVKHSTDTMINCTHCTNSLLLMALLQVSIAHSKESDELGGLHRNKSAYEKYEQLWEDEVFKPSYSEVYTLAPKYSCMSRMCIVVNL